jgi:hypothetical protein
MRRVGRDVFGRTRNPCKSNKRLTNSQWLLVDSQYLNRTLVTAWSGPIWGISAYMDSTEGLGSAQMESSG